MARTTSVPSKPDSTRKDGSETPLNMLPLLLKAEAVLQFQLITRQNTPLATRVSKRPKLLDATSAAEQDPVTVSEDFQQGIPSISVSHDSMLKMIRKVVFGGTASISHSGGDSQTSSLTDPHGSQRTFPFYLQQLQAMEEKILFIFLTLASPELFQISQNPSAILLFPVVLDSSSSASFLDWTSRRFSLLKTLYHTRWRSLFQENTIHTTKQNEIQQIFDFVKGKPRRGPVSFPLAPDHESSDTSPPLVSTSSSSTLLKTRVQQNVQHEPLITPEMNLYQRVQARALFKKQQELSTTSKHNQTVDNIAKM
jgi:hypothetical protein